MSPSERPIRRRLSAIAPRPGVLVSSWPVVGKPLAALAFVAAWVLVRLLQD